MLVWVPTPDGASFMGELPAGTEVVFWNGLEPLPAGANEVEFLVPNWVSKEAIVPLLRTLPRLKVIQVLNAGYEWLLGFDDPSVSICNAGDANAAAVADWCAAAVLSEIKRFPAFDKQQAERRWQMQFGKPLSEHTVVIVGYGAIGKALHERLRPFGCTVIAVASRARDGIRSVEELLDILPIADVVVMLTPLNDATHHLLDADTLALLPDQSIVVNAGRGPIVHTEALMAELESGRLRAVLDVTDPEPLPADHPLWGSQNVRITPHIAGGTTGFFRFTYAMAGDNLRRYVAGEALLNVVAGPAVQKR